jgi:hypothetical protein
MTATANTAQGKRKATPPPTEMGGKQRAKEGDWSDEQMQDAVRIMLCGGPNSGRKSAARRAGIPQASSTVNRSYKMILSITGSTEAETARLREAAIGKLGHGTKGQNLIDQKKPFPEQDELILAEHVRMMSRHGFPMSDERIRDMLLGHAARLGRDDFMCSEHYLTNFVERHKLSSCKSSALGQARADAMTDDTRVAWFNKLQGTIKAWRARAKDHDDPMVPETFKAERYEDMDPEARASEAPRARSNDPTRSTCERGILPNA